MELYDDVNENLGNEDTDMNNTDQGASEQQNVSQESRFKQVEKDAHVTLTLNPSPADNEIASLMDTTASHATTVAEIISVFPTIIPPPPPFFDPLSQQATPTLTPTASETTTSLPTLPDFASVFRFNDRITNIERDLSELKQVDRYAQAISSILAIVDRYMDNKAMSEAAASLSEYEFLKILLEQMEESKSHLRPDYKKKFYDALVETYNTNKDIFEGTKRRKSSKDAESSRDSRSKDKKSSSTSKDTSQDQHNHYSKSAHAEEPSHTVDESGVQQDQEFDMGNNDEQPADKEVTRDDWFKKPKRPLTPYSD
nr:hypothetical protein [Tanacetum cinerariifolium]